MSDNPNDAPQTVPEEGSEPEETPRERASLRGRGWEILRGITAPETTAAAASAEEAAADVVEDAEAGDEYIAAPERARLLNTSTALAATSAAATDAAAEATPRVEQLAADRPRTGTARSTRAEVEALTPLLPETLPDDEEEEAVGTASLALEEAGGQASLRTLNSAADLTGLAMDGAIIRPQDARIDAAQLMNEIVPRPTASELFSDERQVSPDESLLARYVTDARIEKLWGDIEALQEEVVEKVQGDRQLTDVYQKELLQASALLLQDRANYDDVRAILYRVRADLAREGKVRVDTEQYKPQILRYLLFMSLLWVMLMVLEPVFRGFMLDVVQLEPFAAVYHPMLFGMLGAIVNAYFTLNKHAIQLRDFDPVHTSWYLMNPVIGLIMGLLMTLVFGTGIVSTIGVADQSQILTDYPFLLWVLCFLTGYNQNIVLRLLDRMFHAVRGDDDSSSGQTPASD
ncbi:MAG: hypothetical protein JW910_17815 [Anaerolineae bacterium]|nr:hypothetical protein [Anaerolineae bacterium]